MMSPDRELIDPREVLNVVVEYDAPDVLKEAISCFERCAIAFPYHFELIQSDCVLARFKWALEDAPFDVRYASSRLLFAAVSGGGSGVCRALFGSDLPMISLNVLEYDNPEFLTEVLKAICKAWKSVHDYGLEKYSHFIAFEMRFMEILDELRFSEDETVAWIADGIVRESFPELLRDSDI
jgi:hypothetical protein